jgi:hypothetical protein
LRRRRTSLAKLSPNGTATGKAGHPFDKLRTGVRLLINKTPQVLLYKLLFETNCFDKAISISDNLGRF